MARKKPPKTNSLGWLEWKFSTEVSVRELFEKLVWPNGAHCPRCGPAEV